jgi:polyisoprenoid-binding protein YceI
MDTLKINGMLFLHGVTRPIVLNAKINKISTDPATKKSRAGFDAEATLRRSDFGVGKYVPSVADELPVRITLEVGA